MTTYQEGPFRNWSAVSFPALLGEVLVVVPGAAVVINWDTAPFAEPDDPLLTGVDSGATSDFRGTTAGSFQTLPDGTQGQRDAPGSTFTIVQGLLGEPPPPFILGERVRASA